MRRIYHPYQIWEDYLAGMYELKSFDEDGVMKAKRLLAEPRLLEKCMLFVAFNWPYSAEMNLSNLSRNRQAWLGQAACCHHCRVPEQVTKQAWRNLTDPQRVKANKVADKVILVWENEHAKKTVTN